MPKYGYTKMFEKMLSHKNIEIVLNTDYKKIINDNKFNKIIYTGPIDYFFDYEFGKLPYRSIRFEYENYKGEYFQDNAVINYVDKDVTFSRVTEYKYLTGQESGSSTVSYEYFQDEGEPYYPIPTEENDRLFKKYFELTNPLKSVIFCGRLAEYQYYNMDQVVAACLNFLNKI
jgi:UDP-galactopyranose mutase